MLNTHFSEELLQNILKLCLEAVFTRHERCLDFLYWDREFFFNQDPFVDL